MLICNPCSYTMATSRFAKNKFNGRSQAVRLPKTFRFEGNEVYIRKAGNEVILFSSDFLSERDNELPQ
ncbi:antitoxin [Candidatus Marithrix sp. Canyon 246]|uniref:antitoxin n=2 Tax=Candidatus Marithrix sp. Canyon 246 TaxID=1827136 RepID=UPI00209B2DF3|nr:AbrB/MazE/SpoVT family DNA-binding domain-containing protein [Candidatus Marithrix sp. Canyon 246]